jgi:hypothetical protein
VNVTCKLIYAIIDMKMAKYGRTVGAASN